MDQSRRSGGACNRREEQRWSPRKRIRLPSDCYLAGEPFLLTMCTFGRQKLFAESMCGVHACELLAVAAKKTEASLWCGVVMPDHVHLLLSAGVNKSPLQTAACFKRLVTLAVRGLGYTDSVWQRRVHDRGLRAEFKNDLDVAVRYVLDNPVRHELVKSWHQWPLRYLHEDLVGQL